MAEIFATYRVMWESTFDSFGYYTTETFPQGVNVFASTAISNLYSRDPAKPLRGHAFISSWSVYGADGQIVPVSPANPFLNSVFIDDCANITFAAGAGGGYCNTQVTVFRR
jgi:hypothetical protein